MKKSETKTSKPAAPKPTAVPPAFDRSGHPQADWMSWTPEYGYVLLMLPPNCDGDDALQEIEMTCDEYIGLKELLATMRTKKRAA
jgi:hypothetical protein